jgi:hypothetical protein
LQNGRGKRTCRPAEALARGDAFGRDALGGDAYGRDALGCDALGCDAFGCDALARGEIIGTGLRTSARDAC